MIKNENRRKRVEAILEKIQAFEEIINDLKNGIEKVKEEEIDHLKNISGKAQENAKFAVGELTAAYNEMEEVEKSLLETIAALTFAIEGKNL